MSLFCWNIANSVDCCLQALHTARYDAAILTRNNWSYIVGGKHIDCECFCCDLDSCELINVTTKQCRTLPDLRNARSCSTAILFTNQHIVVVGGEQTRTAEILDLDPCIPIRMWQFLSLTVEARTRSCACIYGGYIYVIGGCDVDAGCIEVYDLTTNDWEEICEYGSLVVVI